jgi:hypothetical protein
MENPRARLFRNLLAVPNGKRQSRGQCDLHLSSFVFSRALLRAEVLAAFLVVAGLLAIGAPRPFPDYTLNESSDAAQIGSRSPLVLVQARKIKGGRLDARFPEGSRLVRLWPVAPTGTAELLTSEFFAAADAQVSFGAKRILFAAQLSRGSKWQIWEMNTDGSDKRQLTSCEEDCLKPAYLPRHQIVYTAVSRSGKPASTLVVARDDGSQPHPITFGPAGFQLEKVLANGRILASATYPLHAHDTGSFSRELYTLRPDGTGLTALRCSHKQGTFRGMGEELADGSLLYLETPTIDGLDGTVMRLKRGTIHNAVVSAATSAVCSLALLANGELLISHKGTEGGAAPTTTGKLGLYTFHLGRGSPGQLVYADPEYHCFDPVALSPRPAPKFFWSVVKPELKLGYFIGLQSHLTSSRAHQKLEQVPARVRVVIGDTDGVKAGPETEAPVESDGSFYVAVPADTPIRFQLLAETGRVLHEQESWIWVRPGERRGCLGCHEDRARVPENGIPQILLRSDVPTLLGQRKPTPDAAQAGPQTFNHVLSEGKGEEE